MARYRDFAHVVAKELGLGEIASARILPRGRMTLKVEIRTRVGDRFLIRMYPPGREFVSHYEPALLDALFKAGASVPKLVGSTSHGPQPYLVYSMIPGEPLDKRIEVMSDSHVRDVAEACVDQLRILASLPVNGWGDLVSSKRANRDSWAEFINATIAAVDAAGLEPQLAAAIHVISQVARKPTDRPTLVWTDVSPENIILDSADRFVGMVDMESVMALEPATTRGYLLARYAETRFGSIFQEALNSWTSASVLDPVYAVIRALRLLPYQGTPLPTRRDRDPLDVLLPGLEGAAKGLAMLDQIGEQEAS